MDVHSEQKTVIMESHSEGEVWGLASVDNNRVITTADDNKVKLWNITSRKCESTAIVSDESR